MLLIVSIDLAMYEGSLGSFDWAISVGNSSSSPETSDYCHSCRFYKHIKESEDWSLLDMDRVTLETATEHVLRICLSLKLAWLFHFKSLTIIWLVNSYNKLWLLHRYNTITSCLVFLYRLLGEILLWLPGCLLLAT